MYRQLVRMGYGLLVSCKDDEEDGDEDDDEEEEDDDNDGQW